MANPRKKCRGHGGYTGCQGTRKPVICAPKPLYSIASGDRAVLDSFEMNKVLGAVLGTCLGVVSLNIAAGAVFAPAKLAKPGYDIDVPKATPGGAPQPPAQPEVPLGQLLASADVSRGSESAKKCATCHTFEKGGRALAGPPLWGIVGRAKASVAGFNYSPGMKQVSGAWTIADLDGSDDATTEQFTDAVLRAI